MPSMACVQSTQTSQSRTTPGLETRYLRPKQAIVGKKLLIAVEHESSTPDYPAIAHSLFVFAIPLYLDYQPLRSLVSPLYFLDGGHTHYVYLPVGTQKTP